MKPDEDWGQVVETQSAGLFKFIAKMEIPNDVEHENPDSVVKLMNTFSMVRLLADEKKAPVFDEMRELMKQYQNKDGSVTISYNTKFYFFQSK